MTIRARRRRRILIVLISATAIVGLTWQFYARRERRLDDAARTAREVGLAAFEAGQYERAVRQLGKFIRRLDPSATTLLRFAQATLQLPGADAKHLESAIGALRRCVELDDGNRVAREALLDLYMRFGARTEAIEQATWLLTRNPDHVPALLAKANALAGTDRTGEAVALLKARIRPESPHLEAHLLYLRLLSQAGEPSEAIHSHAQVIHEAHATDARFALVLAQAKLSADDVDGARADIEPLIPLVVGNDEAFAQLLIPYLDAVGLAAASLQVLEQFDSANLGAALRVELIQRLWQVGRAATVAETIEGWELSPERLSTLVLGVQALSLHQLGRTDETMQTVEALERRSKQSAAQAWVSLLRGVILANDATIRQRIDACMSALESDSHNSQARYELGRAYGDAGEVDLAVAELRRAGAMSPNWPQPAAAGANLLARTGRLGEAMRVARVAYSRSSSDAGVSLLVTMARSARPRGTFRERVLEGLENSGIESDQTIPARLALLASLGKRDDVIRTLDEVLQPDASPPPRLLLNCAALSRAQGLGRTEACWKRFVELHGDHPALALQMTRAGIADGQTPEAALAGFRARRQAAKTSGAAWLVTEAQLLDEMDRSEDTLDAWRRASTIATEPSHFQTILAAATPWQDRQLVRTCIDKLRELTGDTCVQWRFYDARWLLTRDSDEAARDAAIDQLKGLLGVVPNHMEARLLLASACEHAGKLREALDHLKSARSKLRHHPVALELRMAGLQVKLGNQADALDTLRKLANSEKLSGENATQLASLLTKLGERGKAVALLQGLAADDQTPRNLLRQAELLASAGRHARAARLIESALENEDQLDAPRRKRAWLLAAAVAEFRAQPKEAQRWLQRVAEAAPDAGERGRDLAGHYKRVGRLALSEKHLRDVIAQPRATSADWLELIACLIRQGKTEAVLATRAPDTHLEQDLLKAVSERAGLRDLGTVYVTDPDRRPVVEQALRLLLAPSTPKSLLRLRSLAEANAGVLSIQLAATRRLLAQRSFKDALAVCRGTADRFPTSSEAARLLAHCYLYLQRMDSARQAAEEWRSRAASTPLAASVFLSRLSAPADAVALLEPFVDRALERGEVDVLRAYGEALIESGDAGRVESVLESRIGSDASLARVWIQLARFAAMKGQSDTARSWLEQQALGGHRGGDLLIDLASAWAATARATDSEDARERSRQSIQLAMRQDLPADAWQQAGLIHRDNGDDALAESAYRKAIARNPDLVVATNNLAMILLETERPQDARPLAEALVKAHPDAADLRDTLALIYIALGDPASAEAQYEEARALQPQNNLWAVRVVEMIRAQGDDLRARRTLRKFRQLHPTRKMSPERKRIWTALEEALDVEPGSASD